jgi:hypothetical protein
MKALVGVVAALVIVGIAALSMLTAQHLSSSPDHVAGPASSDPGAHATAAQPSASMTPWPDLNDLTTSASTSPVSIASESAEQEFSSPVVPERSAQTRTHHRSSMYADVPARHHSRKKDVHKHPRSAATNAVQ